MLLGESFCGFKFNFLLSVRESLGWEVVFTTPPLQRVPQRIALNARPTSAALGGPVLAAVLGRFVLAVLW